MRVPVRACVRVSVRVRVTRLLNCFGVTTAPPTCINKHLFDCLGGLLILPPLLEYKCQLLYIYVILTHPGFPHSLQSGRMVEALGDKEDLAVIVVAVITVGY